MITFDDDNSLDSLTATELANLLTINDVVDFFHSFGVTDLDVTNDTIIAPTICHNPIGTEASKKLYWYQNHHVFHCYTECSENMSIFTLYRKIMEVSFHEEVNFIDAVYYVRRFVHATAADIEHHTIDAFVSTRDRFAPRKQLLYNPDINPCVLDCFLPCTPNNWIAEGISKEAMQKYDIRYSIPQECIVIPHYEYRPPDGKALVGIRCRELNPESIESYGKYHPIYLGDKCYSHRITYCPYGLAQQSAAVRKFRRAVIVEGEKSVMKGYTYYGEDSVIIAACGLTNFSIYDVNLLTKVCGVKDICLAFDKEYAKVNSDEYKKYNQQLYDLCMRYRHCANMSYIIDTHGLLEQKDSPVDKGQAVFERLYKERIQMYYENQT